MAFCSCLTFLALALLPLCFSLHVHRTSVVGHTSLTSVVPSPSETGRHTVLVLGSSGLIGQALTRTLSGAGYNVLEVKHRYHVDLRLDDSMSLFDGRKIDFAFFLACEVGGSKFLHAGNNQKIIQTNNELMYQNVFPYLSKRNIHFLFSSSMHSSFNSTYGKIKKLGESLTSASGGKAVRFWNVFGYEKIGPKSHVISDWLHTCAKNETVRSTTDGRERKQFAHADDIARALIDMMKSFDDLPNVVEATSNEWMSMRQVASMLRTSIGSDCTFTFHGSKSKVTEEIEPKNLWQVDTNFTKKVNEMFAMYKKDADDSLSWKKRTDMFLSIITADTNDQYNGIRSRTFNFVRSLSQVSAVANLDYELILVQYNPKINADYFSKNYSADVIMEELPVPTLLPMTKEVAKARLRVITVTSEHHSFADKGAFWEYRAKNVGARRARGKFLLFTNPDDIFPQPLFSWLAKETAVADSVLTASLMVNFDVPLPTNVQRTCDAVGSERYFCTKVGNCGAPSLGSFHGSGWASNGDAEEVHAHYIGDFTLWSRDTFIKTNGYLEVPQNLHVDSAHKWFTEKTVKWTIVDDTLCHQQHSRDGRPAATFDIPDLFKLHSNRTDVDTWGLHGVQLPESRTESILDWGYNPLTPFKMYRHHPFFAEFVPHMTTSALNLDYLRDFVGTLTHYHFDCDDWARYRRFHLSRRIPCNRHDVFKGMRVHDRNAPLWGDLPIIDEEYYEWLSLLQAVLEYQSRRMQKERPFVIAEFGARYGTWAARGVRAVQTINPTASALVCVVEGDPTGYQWMTHHLQTNVPPSNDHFVLKGVIGTTSNETVGAIQWESATKAGETVQSVTIRDAIKSFDIVDIIHMDIQGNEALCVNDENMDALDQKVKMLHIGTHTLELHDTLKEHFQGHGWSVEHDIAPNNGVHPGRIEKTEFGPINFYWDGELRLINAALQGQ